MKFSRLSLLILGSVLGAAVACSDTAPVSPELTKAPAAGSLTIEGEEVPEGVPTSHQVPTMLYSVSSSSGWETGYAYAQSHVSYFATNALSQATVTTSLGSETGESEIGDALPWNRTQVASAVKYQDACSGTITGKAYGKIWNRFGGLDWAHKSDTDFSSASCPAPPPPSGGGGGGGGGPITCYTLTIDHYWYYPDTGEYEYRYSEYYTWCQSENEM